MGGHDKVLGLELRLLWLFSSGDPVIVRFSVFFITGNLNKEKKRVT